MDARAWSRVPLPAAPGTASFVAALSNLRYGVCCPDRIGEHGINRFAPNANDSEPQPDAFPEIIAFNRPTAQKCLQIAQVFTCILFGGCTVSTLRPPDSSLKPPSHRPKVVSMHSEEEVGRVRTSRTNLKRPKANALSTAHERRNR